MRVTMRILATARLPPISVGMYGCFIVHVHQVYVNEKPCNLVSPEEDSSTRSFQHPQFQKKVNRRQYLCSGSTLASERGGYC